MRKEVTTVMSPGHSFRGMLFYILFLVCTVFLVVVFFVPRFNVYAEETINEGLIKENGKYYFYDSEGIKLKNTFQAVKTDEGKDYFYFGKDGAALVNSFKTIEKKKYYFGKTGKAYKGLHTISGNKYYFKSNAVAVTSAFKIVKKKKYYFKKNGKAEKGWFTKGKNCYFAQKSNCVIKTKCTYKGYKIDKKGRCKTRYKVRVIVKNVTNKKMSKQQKIDALFSWLCSNSWGYTRTYEHTASSWKWYKGWTDDFANSLISNHSGNCYRYAALFGFMVSEATGYKVRVHYGATRGAHAPTVPHGWTTVKQNGTWYAYDPDMYKFHGRSSMYGKRPYSSTMHTIHLGGGYTKLY